MLTITQEKPNQFLLQSSEGIFAKQTLMEKGSKESVLFVYEKDSERKVSIGIVKLLRGKENIEFKIVRNGGKEGILVETDKPVVFEKIQSIDKTMIYISEKMI